MKKETLYGALLYVQKSILGSITDRLIAITAGIEDDSLKLNFYYQKPLLEQERLIVLGTNNYLKNSKAYFNLKLIPAEIFEIKSDSEVPKSGYLVYKRYSTSENKKATSENYLYPKNFKEDLKNLFGENLHPLSMITVQRALLGKITPELKSIALKWENDTIWLYFTYKNERRSKEDQKMEELICKEVMETFPGFNLISKFFIDPLAFHDAGETSQGEWFCVLSKDFLNRA